MVVTVLAIIGGMIVGILCVYGTMAWLARRRRTPSWNFDSDVLPNASDILPTLASLTNSQVYRDSSVEVLQNGVIFDRIIDDCEQASRSIHLETYVWEAGELERRMVETFERAVQRGVRVRLIIDDVGSNKRSPKIFDALRDAGVDLQVFSPLTPTRLHRFNERTHRKLVIVDGTVAYAMGHGISDNWLGNAQDEEHYRDTGVRIQGPAVRGLQSVFAREWAALAHELLYGDATFPPLDGAGNSEICVVSSSVGDRYSYVELAFSLAIATATDEILIQNPYFAPDPDIIDLLCCAAERGVRVVLMLPGSSTDSYLLRLAARHLYPQLLERGVAILEYRPTLLHQKVMIVDGVITRVGSTNFDCRSLELNSEAGLIVRDEAVAAELKARFWRDAELCRPIEEADLKRVSLPARLAMAGVYLLHGQL